MKRLALIFLSAVLFLSACLPKKPEIQLTEAPAGPFLQAIEQRRQSFSGLKAVAGVQVTRKGRRRALDNVAVVLDGQNRLRMEAYGPLGQSILALIWDGKDVQMRLPDSDNVLYPGQQGIERLLGAGIDIKELCAALSGNVPDARKTDETKAFCSRDSECMMEMRQGDTMRRVRFSHNASGLGQGAVITSSELYREDALLFRVRFEQIETIAHYQIPMKVIIENPDKKLSLTLTYNEIEVNIPISDDAFQPLSGEAGAP